VVGTGHAPRERSTRPVPNGSPAIAVWPVGCPYSIFLQIERIWYAAEFVHPTRFPWWLALLLGVVAAALGFAITLKPFTSLGVLVALVAAGFLVTGISEFASAPTHALAGQGSGGSPWASSWPSGRISPSAGLGSSSGSACQAVRRQPTLSAAVGVHHPQICLVANKRDPPRIGRPRRRARGVQKTESASVVPYVRNTRVRFACESCARSVGIASAANTDGD
jgi:hypothetical protein